MNTTQQIASTIKTARLGRDWSIRELARRAGVNYSQLYAIEAGKHSPRISTLERILSALDYDLQPVKRLP